MAYIPLHMKIKKYISQSLKKVGNNFHSTLNKISSVEIIFTQKLLVNSTHNYKETAASYTLGVL